MALTFALDGKAALPPTALRDFKLYPKDDSSLIIDERAAANGPCSAGTRAWNAMLRDGGPAAFH